MRRTKAFTLVELLVVIAIIGLLMTILVPSISKVRELAKRTVCGTNLSSIGKGLSVYISDNRDNYPWVYRSGVNWDTTPTGRNRDRDMPSTETERVDRSITALIFLLVRDKQNPNLFICPSDNEAVVTPTTNYRIGTGENIRTRYYWDFETHYNVSYSYQAPRSDRGTDVKYSSGVSTSSESQLVIMADKTPTYDDESWSPTITWSDRDLEVPEDTKEDMGQTHSEGEWINYLYASGGVAGSKRADVGVNYDSIYTVARQGYDYDQDGTDLSLNNHDEEKDSFLIGPIKGIEDVED